ncbi:dnaJ homolog subfamily C member 14 [Tachysurus fulvidraco]|uniref:dnaJ homolog subfamily C member 14 n=1 Tax=Tachysurus fulvidraco TaxID=1234273 RepID=UPI000F4FFD99|nr:dnaJ homolog subfamily C member 14 [Tachysurus fulvidraco]XP_027024611.1 dnaJ homolog subfamily C member 14 [Tachysurus fulvidraco]XP_027024612.1 dnaJ homolog subfamily C member 14 [Tachysurus fulvidraco]XP_027024613.1 dnaJ homolog subfamily C member 14 [Tachysurus fulvidraco]XP_027024614.1 dnaJ homolog subfamily C member 14 [Tachysurus fulvidraco]XP_047665883.1 dnaJ homolog subfamily C member 14 [Tachysurus fulvidraco]
MTDVMDDPAELSAEMCPDVGSASKEVCEESVPRKSEEVEMSREVPEDPDSERHDGKQQEGSEKGESGYARTNGGMDQLEEDGNGVFDELDEEKDGCRNAAKDVSGSRGKKGKSRKTGLGSGDQFASWTSVSSFSLSSGASRHKQIRRRNHHHHNQGRLRRQTGFQLIAVFREFLSESVSPWSISCIHMVVDLIVSLTHHCGVFVESGAIALYDLGTFLLFKVTDVPGMKQDIRRVIDRTLSTGAALVGWICKSTSSARRVLVSAFSLICCMALLSAGVMRSVVERLGGERGRRWWLRLQNSWIIMKAVTLTGRIRGWLWKRDVSGHKTVNPESPSRTARSQPGQELERLLALAQIPEDELDPFNVLGVNTHATESELKRAYRQLAVQVHPDKNKHPRAGEAFKVLRAAWDIVSNPETRREYELKRMAASELSKSMNEFLTKLQDDLKEAMNTMMCTKCEGKHKRFEMDREPHEARFCAECNKRHSAEEGDLWAESSMLGLKITYFAFMDGKVYDITEWAGCQRIGISPDTHRVPYHISFGSKSNSGSNRHRSPSGHTPAPGSPSDLHDFFSRIFQGAPGSDASPNGGFFPPGPTPDHPVAAGSGPPPQPGFFTQRGEPSESWSEGGKGQRRRKKARKPFQR